MPMKYVLFLVNWCMCRFEYLLYLFLLSFFALSCKHEIPAPIFPEGEQPPTSTTSCDPDSIYFEQQILPIFQSNCSQSGCHNTKDKEADLDLTYYGGIVAANMNDVWEKINKNEPSDIMPPPPYSPLSSAQIALIYDWMKQGLKNNGCEPASCDTSSYKFGAEIWPILDMRCKNCHSGPNPDASLRIENYNDVKFMVDLDVLLPVIRWEPNVVPMPYLANKIPDCEILLIEKWIASGALNN